MNRPSPCRARAPWWRRTARRCACAPPAQSPGRCRAPRRPPRPVGDGPGRHLDAPPAGVASMALVRRFRITCWSWPAWPWTRGRLGVASTSRVRPAADMPGRTSSRCRGASRSTSTGPASPAERRVTSRSWVMISVTRAELALDDRRAGARVSSVSSLGRELLAEELEVARPPSAAACPTSCATSAMIRPETARRSAWLRRRCSSKSCSFSRCTSLVALVRLGDGLRDPELELPLNRLMRAIISLKCRAMTPNSSAPVHRHGRGRLARPDARDRLHEAPDGAIHHLAIAKLIRSPSRPPRRR